MIGWLCKLLAGRKAAGPPRTRRRVRLELEALEERRTPTITYHGGALLTHVQAQAVYLGADWANNPAYAAQAQYLDSFVKFIVNSSFMDMLTNTGYGVGRGTATAGVVNPLTLNKSAMLTDAGIEADLQQLITAGKVQPPTANRLYVVFVEDNVPVGLSDGENSRTDFISYHGAYAGTDPAGNATDIRYVVVPYPGGTIANLGVPALPAVNSMTEGASHEIAESVTDPDVNYAALGWYDDTLNDEAADLVNQEFVTLGGFAVQRVADQNDQGMTPAGAAPLQAVSFTLLSSGQLYEHVGTGWTWVYSGVAAVSNQGIDDNGRATVDVLLANGDAYEYHDGGHWTFLTHNVRAAQAGQGVSYVLLNDGRLYEYRDDTGGWSELATGIAAIDAGTDRFGSNMVDAISTSGVLAELSDTTGRHPLYSGIQAVSAGSDGISLVLLKNGSAYEYNETTSTWTYLAAGVAQLTAGTDIGGAPLFELLSTSGNLTAYRPGIGMQTVASAVASVGKARNGLVDIVFLKGTAYENTASGWAALTTTVRQAT